MPSSTNGQAGGAEPDLGGVIEELTAQQAVLAENQAQIDAKLALIIEDLRLARIFVARGGGKAPAK